MQDFRPEAPFIHLKAHAETCATIMFLFTFIKKWAQIVHKIICYFFHKLGYNKLTILVFDLLKTCLSRQDTLLFHPSILPGSVLDCFFLSTLPASRATWHRRWLCSLPRLMTLPRRMESRGVDCGPPRRVEDRYGRLYKGRARPKSWPAPLARRN